MGKAVAFALARLGAKSLRLYDTNKLKAKELASAVTANYSTLDVQLAATVEQASDCADGLVNCSPLGMVGSPGSAFPRTTFGGRHWAFDAVYTPIDTQFLVEARAAGLSIMSGYELYLYQGIGAFRCFTGQEIDPTALREALAKSDPELRRTA